MKKFERSDITTLRAEINAALEAVAKKHGITLTARNASYSPTSFKISVEGAIIDAAGAAVEAKRKWDYYALMFGLKPENFGQQFTYQHNLYEIVGCNPNAPKYPIEGKCLVTGRVMRFTTGLVQRGLLSKVAKAA